MNSILTPRLVARAIATNCLEAIEISETEELTLISTPIKFRASVAIFFVCRLLIILEFSKI